MPEQLIIHASRSRYEAFMKCMRLGYLQYHWGGRGIVKAGFNLFLITGIFLHVGLELIGKWLKANPKARELRFDMLEGILAKVRDEYFKAIFPKNWKDEGGGYDLRYESLDEITGERREISEYEMELKQQYTFDEQSALVEALLRVFAFKVLPSWMSRFRIVTVENDMSFSMVKGEGFEVIQSAKVDWVLQEIETKDLFLVSFKGYRTYGNNEAKAASHDTQGLSESWAFDEYLKTKGINKRIMGVKMLYLIKGARKETKRGNGRWEQQSPLIRGYRKLTEEGPAYAHSYFFPDTRDEDRRNESGITSLGRSWDKVEIFKEWSIKEWIELLANEDIQPECGDILSQQVMEPEVYLRGDREIASWLRQTQSREEEIAQKLLALNEEFGTEPLTASDKGLMALDVMFPQNRAACHYYPGDHNDCQYVGICFGTAEEGKNPLEDGFVYRTPHHKAELLQIEGVK